MAPDAQILTSKPAQTPQFSIISITLNHLEGLKRTQDSLRIQTHKDFEWLVIDGASHDGTIAWLESIGAPYISEPDHGLYDAMNKGIERARGHYILLLNAGDTLATPETLEILARTIKDADNTPDFIYGDALERDASGRNRYKPARPHRHIRYGMFTHHQAMLYRRDAIGRMRYDLRYKIAADYDLTARFLSRLTPAQITYTPHPICIFEPGGLSQRKAHQGRGEQFMIRLEQKTVPLWLNSAIYAAQSLRLALRSIAPGVYWRLINRRKAGR